MLCQNAEFEWFRPFAKTRLPYCALRCRTYTLVRLYRLSSLAPRSDGFHPSFRCRGIRIRNEFERDKGMRLCSKECFDSIRCTDLSLPSLQFCNNGQRSLPSEGTYLLLRMKKTRRWKKKYPIENFSFVASYSGSTLPHRNSNGICIQVPPKLRALGRAKITRYVGKEFSRREPQP